MLMLSFLACSQSAPHPDPPLAWTASTDRLTAKLQPERPGPNLRTLQNWILELRTVTGESVYPAQIGIDGGMPSHGHGLPTSPRVTEYLGKGRYRIEGLEFNMGGTWRLNVSIASAAGRQQIQFDIELDP